MGIRAVRVPGAGSESPDGSEQSMSRKEHVTGAKCGTRLAWRPRPGRLGQMRTHGHVRGQQGPSESLPKGGRGVSGTGGLEEKEGVLMNKSTALC